MLEILKSTKISDYFKAEKQKFTNVLLNKDKSNNNIRTLNSEKIQELETECLKTRFKLPKDSTKQNKLILKESLMRALLVKNIKFDDDLYYDGIETFSYHNNSSLEIGVQKVSEYNLEIYKKFKQKTREADYPSLQITEDPDQGFIVKATDDISPLTLICEYTGEVHFARKKLFDKNDSIMDLLRTPNSSTSLVIAPEQRGNLARFISGINNNSSGRKKQNVSSIRLDIEGSVHVLLYASKKIKKGEVLYYDYNAGGFSGYPTEHFI